MDPKLVSSKGGIARSNVLSPEQRKEIARTAAKARWGGDADGGGPQKLILPVAPQPSGPPHSQFSGKLKIGDLELECHVLNDGRRVFTQRVIVEAISGGRRRGDLGAYLNSNPLIPKDFGRGREIDFRIPGLPGLAVGREATTLVEICESYLEADEQGLLKANQKKLAKQAQIIIRSCAKVGIIALIDEVTGYQKVRAKNALQLKLHAFIADEMQDWARAFPTEFWFELARLEGIHYSPRSRPLRWGKYVMAFVYDAIDPDIGQELRKKNPNPQFRRNHHQWLREFGKDKLQAQLQKVITIMQLCDNMDDFRKKFARVFKKTPLQMEFADLVT